MALQFLHNIEYSHVAIYLDSNRFLAISSSIYSSFGIAFSFSSNVDRLREITFCPNNTTVEYVKKALVSLIEILFSFNIENFIFKCVRWSINVWKNMIISLMYT